MRQLFVLGIFLLLVSCWKQERNCLNFHTGTFKSSAFVGDQLLETTFIRNDSLEIDIFEGKADTATIRWINDCEYILTRLNAETFAEKQSVHIKILTTKGNSYMYEYNLVGGSKKERSTATKIE